MARRSQSSSQGDNPLDPNYLPPHYKEYYRIAIDVLAENGPEAYERFLGDEGAPDFLCNTEIDLITKTLQRPPEATQENLYLDNVYSTQEDADGSSGTYWPMHSDTAAPELDLGWPTIFGFQGTEVTTLIHPPPPDNPSIKEEIRRMIRSAQQVIAIVMDIFTDVDILGDLLDAAARRVPVYIILDEMNSQHFLDMAAKCRINLNYVEFLRVRTVSGPTYYCRTGITFKGNLVEKFLLVDCTVVLSDLKSGRMNGQITTRDGLVSISIRKTLPLFTKGISFMWSFEKLHRSMVHIFQGELVSSFDEEFRILFAQSDPLIPPMNALAKMEKPFMGMVPFTGPRPLFDRKLHFMYPRDDSSQNSFPNFGVDPDRHYFQAFRREEMMRQTMDNSGMRMFGRNFAEQMEMDKMQMSFMQSKQMELEAYKRHSFAEGTHENYSASRQYNRQMVVNNDEYRFQSNQFQKTQFMQLERPFSPSRPQGLFEKIRGNRQGFQDMDENDSRFLNKGLPGESNFALEGPHIRLGYNPSSSSREVRHGSDQVMIGGEGRFGQRSQGRQKFMCQISPTQKQGMEQRQFFQDQDADKKTQENKQGLRSWRISSYLSNIQSDNDEEGMPMPMDTEGCDDALVPVESAVPASETLLKYSIDPAPQYKSIFSANDVPMSFEKSVVPASDNLYKYAIDPIPPYKPSASANDVSMSLEKSLGRASETLHKFSIDPIPPYKPLGSSNDVSMSVEKAKESLMLEKEKEDTLLARHDSFRTRTNPLIQRGSRLRSSLIFSSSKIEQHSSTAEMVQVVQKEQSTKEVINENGTTKTSSKVAEILEKYRSGNKDNDITTMTQAKAASTVIHEESEEGQKKTTEAVAYKAMESSVLEKDSFSRTLLESQYKSSVTSKIPDLFSKDKPTSSVTKFEQMASSIQTIESRKSSPEKKESGPIITEITEEPQPPAIEAQKSQSRPNSAVLFGNALESMSYNPTPVSALNKSEEEISKPDQNPMEFIRRGSMKLKQFLQSKAEKKVEGELASDAVKAEKQNSSLRHHSKTESQESLTVVDSEEKTTKLSSVTPPKPAATSQTRLSSTSNVIFSSNLRDDTKVILEQISANSQKNRAEMAKQALQSQSSNDSDTTIANANSSESKVEEPPSPDAASLSRAGSFLSRSRFSRPPPSSPEDRDNLLRRMESIRKEKKVYSRFEVFCKKEEQPSQIEESEDESKDKKAGKFMPRLLGTLINKK